MCRRTWWHAKLFFAGIADAEAESESRKYWDSLDESPLAAASRRGRMPHQPRFAQTSEVLTSASPLPHYSCSVAMHGRGQ